MNSHGILNYVNLSVIILLVCKEWREYEYMVVLVLHFLIIVGLLGSRTCDTYPVHHNIMFIQQCTLHDSWWEFNYYFTSAKKVMF